MTEFFLFSGIVLLAALLGVMLGHLITMKGIAHVQPSTSDMAKQMGSVSDEPDPWDNAFFDPTPDESPEPEDEIRRESVIEKLKEMNLNTADIEADMAGAAMRPVRTTTGQPKMGARDET